MIDWVQQYGGFIVTLSLCVGAVAGIILLNFRQK